MEVLEYAQDADFEYQAGCSCNNVCCVGDMCNELDPDSNCWMD